VGGGLASIFDFKEKQREGERAARDPFFSENYTNFNSKVALTVPSFPPGSLSATKKIRRSKEKEKTSVCIGGAKPDFI
jgi:hypothetical protein